MNKIIVSKVEYEFLILALEELYNVSSDEAILDKWVTKLGDTRKLFDLELGYYNIRCDGNDPTKKQMIQWLITKIKNKTADL